MTRRRTQLAPWLLCALGVTLAACAGPPVAAPIANEPICGDLEIAAGHTKLEGGLRYPVQLRIVQGKSQQMKMILIGKRTPASPPSQTYIVDDNAEYTLEWAQCVNERAPKKVDSGKVPTRDAAAYECGEATIYKTETLVTKKHDRDSHKVTFVPPPNAACWAGEGAQPAPKGSAPPIQVIAPPAVPLPPPPPPPPAGSASAGTPAK